MLILIILFLLSITQNCSGCNFIIKRQSKTTGQGEDYITGCLLDYDYMKNHYKLIAIDLSTQK